MTHIETIGSLAEVIFSGRPTSRFKTSAGGKPIRLLTPRDVGSILAKIDELEQMEVDPSSDLVSIGVQAGDIVITSRGTLRVAVARPEHIDAIPTANLIVVRLKEIRFANVLAAYLRAPSTAWRLQLGSRGTATVGFGVQDLKSLPVALPDDGQVDTLNNLVELTDQYAEAVLRSVESRRLVAQELVRAAFEASEISQ